MNKSLLSLAAAGAMLSAPLAANAVVYQFNASLNGAQETPAPVITPATGLATLMYDDMGTLATADDLYSFSLFASGMSGMATAAHIHGPAPVGVGAPPIVTLDSLPFAFVTTPFFTMIGGAGISASPTLLTTLMAGHAYVNLHTVAHGSGEIRGQLVEVSVVPEPSTYAMLLGGLAVLGFAARRRQG